jgi:Mg-chelatase subunit ChlD
MEYNERSKLNLQLLIFTFAAGLFWWPVGELIIYFFARNSPWPMQNSLIVGIYFAMLASFTILACFLSESKVHSIVNRSFFKTFVAVPQFKSVLAVSVLVAFFVAGIFQFIYEYDWAINKKPKQTQKPVAPKKTAQKTSGFDDYYYVVDNSSSMEWNDPKNERIRLLSRIIDNLPEERQIALVSFGDYAEILIPLQPATDKIKKEFRSYIDIPKMFPGTNIMGALEKVSGILNVSSNRKGVVILVSDGESNEYDFDIIISRFNKMNISVYTIMLNPPGSGDVSERIKLLQKIADATGGKQFTVDNFEDMEIVVVQTMNDPESSAPQILQGRSSFLVSPESKRIILARREETMENSFVYSIIHILFIVILEFILGYTIFMMFSHRDIFKPLIVSGAISGLLAGLVLEAGLQFKLHPVFVRFLTCVILSTLIWNILYLYDSFALSYKWRDIFYAGNRSFAKIRNENLYAESENKLYQSGIIDANSEDRGNSPGGELK